MKTVCSNQWQFCYNRFDQKRTWNLENNANTCLFSKWTFRSFGCELVCHWIQSEQLDRLKNVLFTMVFRDVSDNKEINRVLHRIGGFPLAISCYLLVFFCIWCQCTYACWISGPVEQINFFYWNPNKRITKQYKKENKNRTSVFLTTIEALLAEHCDNCVYIHPCEQWHFVANSCTFTLVQSKLWPRNPNGSNSNKS